MSGNKIVSRLREITSVNVRSRDILVMRFLMRCFVHPMFHALYCIIVFRSDNIETIYISTEYKGDGCRFFLKAKVMLTLIEFFLVQVTLGDANWKLVKSARTLIGKWCK